MASYLITGASRGIGLELTKQLLELPASKVGQVFATTRGDLSGPLQALINNNPQRAVHVTAAVDDTQSVQDAAEQVKAHLGGQGLDVLINSAGIVTYNPDGVASAPPEEFTQVFDVNVLGPQRVIAAFLPLLKMGREKKVINISTTVGSISLVQDFKRNPSYPYKVTKAALNMLIAQYAMEYADAGFIFLCVSPGWLRTGLGGSNAHLDVATGASEIKRITLEATTAQNGKFLNIHVPGMDTPSTGGYDGKEIPW